MRRRARSSSGVDDKWDRLPIDEVGVLPTLAVQQFAGVGKRVRRDP